MNSNTGKKISESGKYFFLVGFAAATTLLVFIGMYSNKEENNSDSSRTVIKEVSPQDYRIISPPVPENLSFLNENVPVNNFDVRERIDRELLVNTYWHSATMLALKKANRWFPVVEQILKKYNIPEDFKYLALVESGFENVVSPRGAAGFWQLMPKTAKEYELEVNSYVDERYHVEKSTIVACKYLRKAYNDLGNWTLAAAAYNMGIKGIQKQIERQKSRNYYNLYLNEQTSRYVARIIAVKQILNNPRQYGFFLEESDLYPPFEWKEVIINEGIDDLADFAHKYNIDYKTLKIFNPWLRDDYLTNKSGKTYRIKIPVEGSIELIEDEYLVD